MLELGELAAAEHLDLLAAADRCGADQLVLVGSDFAAALGAAASASPAGRPLKTPCHAFADSAAAAAAIGALVDAGDLLLVKGSRGVRMERLIEALLAAPQDGSQRRA